MLSNGGDEVLNGVLEGGLEDIIEQIIKDVVASDVILELSNLSHDSFKEVNQKSFASLNMSLGLLNDILDSCINLLQDSLDSRGGLGNFSFNNSLDFVQEVKNAVLNLSRFNLGFDLVEDILQVLGGFHDVSNGNVFLGLELVSKISKMFADGGDEVLNGVLEGGLEDIIEQIIKDVVASDVILELSNLSHDSFKEVNQKSFASLNMSLGLLNDILDSC